MILKSLKNQFLLKKIKTILYLESQLNKTYGSISKPINHFGQNNKFSHDNIHITDINQSDAKKDHKTADNLSQMNIDDDEGAKQRRFQQKKNKELAFFFKLNKEEKLNLIEDYRQRQMTRELSIICREMYYYHEKSEAVWKAIEGAFVSFLNPPYDQNKIRSLGKFLFGLEKCKRLTKDYEKLVLELFPHSSIQSFVQLVVIMSRLGTLSQQFLQNTQKFYWERKEQFGPLQLNLINYVFAKNSRKIDTTLIEKIDTFSLRCIALMLKTFDKSSLITYTLLKNCVQPILLRKAETNFFDLKHLVNVYLKYQYFESFHLLIYFDEQYRILSKNVNEETFEEIWQYFPDAVNKNKLPPTFVQDVIQSLKTLHKNKKISERAWKKISLAFPKFTNSQIREDLEKLKSQ